MLDGPGLHERLRAGLSRGGAARFAVAFWGSGAFHRLGLRGACGHVEVLCNLGMGGTNPTEIRHAISLGARVVQSDDLHAKIYLLDDFGAVGSSNASTNGLALEGSEVSHWDEANVVFDRDGLYAEADRLYREFRQRARKVREADLVLAESSWVQRRRLAFATTYQGGSKIRLTYDEWVVMLAARQRHPVGSLTARHEATVELSRQLRRMAFPDGRPPEGFREPKGLSDRLKILDIFRPGYEGPRPHVSEGAREVWERYGEDAEECQRAARAILEMHGASLAG